MDDRAANKAHEGQHALPEERITLQQGERRRSGMQLTTTRHKDAKVVFPFARRFINNLLRVAGRTYRGPPKREGEATNPIPAVILRG